jgi:CubicO group peptidase (beta-lactamase class C family)
MSRRAIISTKGLLARISTARALSLCCLLAPALTFGAITDVARMERAIDLQLSTGKFMGAVLVSKDGKILINKGYGYANLDRKVPNTPATKFRIGSVTKQFTAACILLLEERGKLTIDDLVRKYLPDAPPSWDHITIFNLLTHTSGIPDYSEFPDFMATRGTPTAPEQLVARFRDKPLEFAPGSSFKYSNSGYVLLGYLIERISGEPYSKFVQDNIFTPLGMKDSGYGSPTRIIPRHAAGYAPGPNGPVVAPYVDMSVAFSAGGLYSTTGDLSRWEQALYGGEVLTAVSLHKMMTPFRHNYALGLGARKTPNGERLFWHNGGVEGFRAWVGYLPAENVDVVVLENLNGLEAQTIGNDIVRVADGERAKLISDHKAIALPTDALDRLSGHFQLLSSGEIITVRRNGEHLTTQIPGHDPVEFYAEGKGDFFARSVDEQISFTIDAQGSIARLVLRENGEEYPAKRIDDASATGTINALNDRVAHQTPVPGSAMALRRYIDTIRAGSPNYDEMEAELAATVHEQLPDLRARLVNLGAIRSLEFERVLPAGTDVYQVNFEHGTVECRIHLGADGKIAGERFMQGW